MKESTLTQSNPQEGFRRAWSEVQRFLLEKDWVDSLASANEKRDYGYLYGFLKKFNLLAAERFGGYHGCATPFHLMHKEQEKKAFPLAFCLAARAPLDVIKEVYWMYPRAISERQGEHHGVALHIACRHGAGAEVIDFLIEEYREAVNLYDRHSNLPLHYAAKCKNTEEKLRVVRLLVERESKSSSIVQHNVFGVSPLSYAIRSGGNEEEIVRYFVSRLPGHLEQLQFNGVIVREAFALNLVPVVPKLRSLVLRGSTIEPNALMTTLGATSAENPLTLSMGNCKFREPILNQNEINLDGIQDLTIDNCYFSKTCFAWFLDRVLRMNTLRILTLTNPNKLLRSVDITAFLVRILRIGHLVELTIYGHALMLQDLINVLAHGNTTTYVDYKNTVHDNRLLYYSVMNRFGRAAARDPTTPRDSFVNCLSAMFQQRADYPMSVLTAATYGLLRECPTIWSTELR